MGYNNGPKIVADDLVFCVDASTPKSYPGSGDYWYDLVSGNVGYIGSSSAYSTGAFNSAYRPAFTDEAGGSFLFDGSDDIVVFPDSASHRDVGSALSVFSWAKPTAAVTTYRNILARRDASNIGGYILHNTSNNSLQCYVYNNTWRSATVANVYEANKWCYVGFTYDGASIRLYKNGQYLGLTGAGSGGVNPVGSTVRIGGNGIGSQNWLGYIASAHIYTATLTDAQILLNYNAQRARFGL